VHQAHDLHAGLIDGADGHDQWIDDDVAGRDAVVDGALDDFLATAKRTSGSSEIPVSSFEMAITAAPYFLMSGSTDSSRSSRRLRS